MDGEKPYTIESADVYDCGVIVTFPNGKFAFYSAALLWSIFEKAAELHGTVEDAAADSRRGKRKA